MEDMDIENDDQGGSYSLDETEDETECSEEGKERRYRIRIHSDIKVRRKILLRKKCSPMYLRRLHKEQQDAKSATAEGSSIHQSQYFDLTASDEEQPKTKEPYDKNYIGKSYMVAELRSDIKDLDENSDESNVAYICKQLKHIHEFPDAVMRTGLLHLIPDVAECLRKCKSAPSMLPIYSWIDFELLPNTMKAVADQCILSNYWMRTEANELLRALVKEGAVQLLAVEGHISEIYDAYYFSRQGDPNANLILAGNFITRMAPIIGDEKTELIIVPRLTRLCASSKYKVRESCAHFLVDIAFNVNSIIAENIIIPHYERLCHDHNPYVRKACAETITAMSAISAMETRHSVLAPTMVSLMKDRNSIVSEVANCHFAAFLTTFAQPAITGLATNRYRGEYSLVYNDEFFFDLYSRHQLLSSILSEFGNIEMLSANSPARSSQSQESQDATATNQSQSHEDEAPIRSVPSSNNLFCDTTYENQPDLIQSCLRNNVSPLFVDLTRSDEASTDKAYENDDHDDYDDDNEFDDDEDDGSPKSSLTRVENIVITVEVENNQEVDDHFNSFQYWREPIAELDNITSNEQVLEEPQEEDEETKIRELKRRHREARERLMVTMGTDRPTTGTDRPTTGSDRPTTGADRPTMATDRPTMGSEQHKMGAAHVRKELQLKWKVKSEAGLNSNQEESNLNNTPTTSNKNPFPKRWADLFALPESPKTPPKPTVMRVSPPHSVKPNAQEPGAIDLVYTTRVILSRITNLRPESSNADVFPAVKLPKQSVLPASLLDVFMWMCDSNCLEERTLCARALPAVLLTVGAENWPYLKPVYTKLSIDPECSLRQLTVHLICELAQLLGATTAKSDLVPIFTSFASDNETIKMTALGYLAKFMRLLQPDMRSCFMPYLDQFWTSGHWRYRDLLAEQLVQMVDTEIFNTEQCWSYIAPVAFNLLMDRVAAVREKALELMMRVVKSMESDMTLTRNLLAELAEQFAHSSLWTRRQVFAALCSQILAQGTLSTDIFARDVLPHLLDLSWDGIPNVRLAVARTLAFDIITHEYFSSAQNPHYEVLMEVLNRLHKDTDRDVRYFASQAPGFDSELSDQLNDLE